MTESRSRLLFPLLLLPLLLGCGWGRPLLDDVRLEPHTTISPNADGSDDLTRVYYSLAAPARISISFVDANGREFVWREQEPRAAGDYEGWFSGVVEGRVLPDGPYTMRVRALPTGGGEPVVAEESLQIIDADREPPEIVNLTVTPAVVTPNRDGIGDEVVISYWLSKPMERVAVYLIGPDGQRHFVPPEEVGEVEAAGGHSRRYHGGAGDGAVPPPDGQYEVVVEAHDRIGARDVATATLTIEGGGLPLAEITRHDVEFSSDVLVVGETLFFTTTVTNAGTVPVRTHGPPAGVVYDSTVNYNNYAEPIEDGAWRLGLDFEGNRVYNGRRYPYRWQLGANEELTIVDGEHYLMPGQTVTVNGGLRLLEIPPRERPGFWIGLIHENVRFVEDFIGTSYITIEHDGSGAPTTGGTGDGP